MRYNARIIEKLRQEQKELESERKRLKWFLVLAVTLWPLGLFWQTWVAALIFISFICFYLSGCYFSFFHRRECTRKLEEACSASNNSL